MRVLLVDVDSKIPNLALMKLSTYFKSLGDEVGFNVSNPDFIYTSTIFTKNAWKSEAIQTNYPYSQLISGGVGIGNDQLPDFVDRLKPDYDLYPSTYSQGFTTRGCNRSCYFCRVPAIEGKLRRYQHPSIFHDDRFDTMMVMDNNWLMDKEWFMETSGWILDQDLKLIEGGMDIRCVDEEIAKRLADLKIKNYHFAFDFPELEPIVIKKCHMLKDAGIRLRDIQFYIYSSPKIPIDSILHRCNLLKSLGANPFLMWDPSFRRSKHIRKLIHWANRKALFWKCSFEEVT